MSADPKNACVLEDRGREVNNLMIDVYKRNEAFLLGGTKDMGGIKYG